MKRAYDNSMVGMLISLWERDQQRVGEMMNAHVAKANCYIEEELFVMLIQTGLRSMTNADRKTESEYCSGCYTHVNSRRVVNYFVTRHCISINANR